MEHMDYRLQFLFFVAGAACFFMAAFKEDWPPDWKMTHRRYTALGWLFFITPFVINSALAGW